MNIYLRNVAHAREELTRLRSVEAKLSFRIVQLLDDSTYDGSTWRKIFTDRLRDNVRPAIKECQDFIKRAA